MDQNVTLNDGSANHVFAPVEMSPGRCVRTSRTAAVGTPINLVVQHSTKKGVTRSNIKIDYSYTDSLGILHKETQSYTHTWERNLAPSDAQAKSRALVKAFLADAAIMEQFDRVEL